MYYEETNGFIPQAGEETNAEELLARLDKKSEWNVPQIDLSKYRTYYFDAEKGDDKNDGRSEKTPKRSVAAIAQAAKTCKKYAGVRLLLKRNAVFEGDLVLGDFEADEKYPLIVSAYGDGEKRPVIVGKECTLRLTAGNARICDLEITGKEALQGIYVTPAKCGAMKNIVIENCYVHDINFDWIYETKACDTDPDTIDIEKVCPEYEADGKTYSRYHFRNHGGIILLNATTENEGASWLENVYILDNTVENVARTGITVYSRWSDKAGVGYGFNKFVDDTDAFNAPERSIGYYVHKNVVCVGNTVVCAGGDAIVLSSVDTCILEHNVSYYANYLGRVGYWNAAIWVFNVKDALFRYNEAAYTYMRYGSEDAQGYDLDNACRNVLFRYNYAHHNEGGGLLMCNNKTVVKRHTAEGELIGEPQKEMGAWYNNLVCDNVFVYNGNPKNPLRSAFITIAREVDWVWLWRNTVVLRDDIENQSVVNTEDVGRYCRNHFYEKNLFYAPSPVNARLTDEMILKRTYEGNLYYNVGEEFPKAAKDENAVSGVDPKIEIPADFRGYEKITAFAARNSFAKIAGARLDPESKKSDNPNK